jgi:hypothetical protein
MTAYDAFMRSMAPRKKALTVLVANQRKAMELTDELKVSLCHEQMQAITDLVNMLGDEMSRVWDLRIYKGSEKPEHMRWYRLGLSAVQLQQIENENPNDPRLKEQWIAPAMPILATWEIIRHAADRKAKFFIADNDGRLLFLTVQGRLHDIPERSIDLLGLLGFPIKASEEQIEDEAARNLARSVSVSEYRQMGG